MILSIVQGQFYEFVNHKLEGKINQTQGRTCSSVQPLFQQSTQDLISAHRHALPLPPPQLLRKDPNSAWSPRFEVITKTFFGG